jgi:hypothetical protein
VHFERESTKRKIKLEICVPKKLEILNSRNITLRERVRTYGLHTSACIR